MRNHESDWNEFEFTMTVETTLELLRAEAADVATDDQFVGGLLGRLADYYEDQAQQLSHEFLDR